MKGKPLAVFLGEILAKKTILSLTKLGLYGCLSRLIGILIVFKQCEIGRAHV